MLIALDIHIVLCSLHATPRFAGSLPDFDSYSVKCFSTYSGSKNQLLKQYLSRTVFLPGFMTIGMPGCTTSAQAG